MAGACQHDVVNRLRSQLQQQLQNQQISSSETENSAASDLIKQALQPGKVSQWVSAGAGQLTVSIVLSGLAQSEYGQGNILVIDRQRTFFWPAVAASGLSAKQIFFVRPVNDADALWATEQALRSPGVTAVVCLGLTIPPLGQGTVYRRFQLAAQTGKTIGILYSASCRSGGSRWADMRMQVEPLPGCSQRHDRRVRVRLMGGRLQGLGRHRSQHQELIVSYDESTGHWVHEQHHVSVLASVVDSTAQTQSA